MAKAYAICCISGLIRIVEGEVPEKRFALAVGEREVVGKVLAETADHRRVGAPLFVRALFVPGTSQVADSRENLGAIARYIQTLAQLNVPDFRALGA